MKAIVISIAEEGTAGQARKTSLKFDSHPDPDLRENQLLVRVAASPIQPSDLLNAQGNFPITSFPRVPGRDFAGVVVQPASSQWHGKRVYGTSGPVLGFTCDGAHAEFVAVPDNAVAEVPEGMDLKQASVLGVPWTTAHVALTRASAKRGETVLVFGAGGAVGGAVVQLAKSSLFGCRVLTAGRGDKYEVDTTKHPDLAVTKDLTSGRGPDVVVDTTGDLGLIRAGLHQLSKGGRLAVITIGSTRQGATLDVDIKELYRLEHSIVGCNSVEHSGHEMALLLQKMKTLFESGELKAPDLSRYTEVKLEEVGAAYEELSSGTRKKFVIVNN